MLKLSKLKLHNYRCFGEDEQIIKIDDITSFIGNNSSGKTAALLALNCLFSDNSADRVLKRSDFHLPKDTKPEEMDSQELYIEAVFVFDELENGEEGASSIPTFFRSLVVDNPDGTPYLRIRLEATWEKSSNVEGAIESKIYYITCPEGEPIVEMLISLLRLVIDRKRPHDWEFIVSTTADLWNIGSLQSNDDYFKMQDALSEEIEQLSGMMQDVTCKKDFHALLKHAIQFWGGKRIKATFPIYSQGTYLNDLLNKFQNYMWMELDTTEMDWLLAIENFEGLHSVPIMTIHKSKGLEYEVVYFVGLEDSAFWSFKNQPEEDRCTFFVALSRAKKEILFTFCKYRYTSRYPKQSHDQINEFFDLLRTPGIATIIE